MPCFETCSTRSCGGAADMWKNIMRTFSCCQNLSSPYGIDPEAVAYKFYGWLRLSAAG